MVKIKLHKYLTVDVKYCQGSQGDSGSTFQFASYQLYNLPDLCVALL